MRWWVVTAAVVLTAGCGSGDRSVVVTPGGRIGPLQMDRSTAADVVAFAGRPDAERKGVEGNSTPYVALGYDCSSTRNDDRFPVLETTRAGRGGPACKTVFWVNRRTGRLGDFYTSVSRYVESHGATIGMATARAERLLDRRVDVGCEENIYVPSAVRRVLTVAFTGGAPDKMRGSSELHLVGGRVYAFALHGYRSDIGIFDCL